jgi:sensor histidine kinase YesM
MKKLVILSALLFVTHWVFASELPKLNLEIGKTFTIETITHVDTSSQSPYRIWDEHKWKVTPLFFDLGKQVYCLKMEMTYYRHVRHEKNAVQGWQESEVYETGYLMSYRSPVVHLNASKAPVFVEIRRDGVITSFDFSEYDLAKTPEGEPLKLAQHDQSDLERYLQRLFFHNPNSDECSKNKKIEPGEYSIIDQNEDKLILNVSRAKDWLGKTEVMDERIILDKKTGLIVQKHKNYHVNKMKPDKTWEPSGIFNNAVYFQKNYSDFSLENMKTRFFDRAAWIDTTITTANTLIKAKIANRISGEDSVDVFIEQNNNDCYRLPLSNTNEIELGLTFDKPTSIRIQYPKPQQGNSYQQFRRNYKKSTFCFDAGAGDHINLELGITDSSINLITVNGIYSTCFNHEKELQFLYEHPLSDINFNWKKEKYLPLINEYRLHADPRIYLNKLVGITYWEEMENVIKYMDPMRRISPQARQEDYKINPIENVVINNSLAKENPNYLPFLDFYLNYISLDRIQNLIGVQTFNSKTTVENRYFLAEALLAEPVKSNYLAFYINNILHNENPEVAKSIFESFRRNYKEKAIYPVIEKTYNRFMALTTGNVAPDFTLMDIYGTKYSLSDFKKKVVVLHFYNYPWSKKEEMFDHSERFIKTLEKTDNKSPNDVFHIFLLNGNNKKLIEQIKQNKYRGIFLIAEDGSYLSTSKVMADYNLPADGTEFLINRNGKIAKRTNFWHSEIHSSEINEVLAIPYQHSYNNLPLWIRIALISLSGALAAIALTFLLYRMITKRRLQKSELNKRMRELELTAIRAQMNPHFMYNCLNSIQNLVQKNRNDEAHLYLSKFATLIRQVLNTSKKEEVSLAEELETINGYIDLEKLRFDFDYRLTIEDGIEPVSIFLPPMLLQPLVENALLHGLLPKPTNRKLEITIGKRDSRICILIEDNGIGRDASKYNTKSGNGKGLELTRERLTLMAGKYNTYYKMDIEDMTNPEGQSLGTRATICFEEE